MSISGLVRQDETWIAVDRIVGCKMDCKYCFLQIYNQTQNAGKILTPPDKLIEQLLQFSNYTENSYIMIGSETDVFMHYKNVEYLIQLISLIQYKGIKNKIILVTKNVVPVEFINFVIKNSLQDKITFYFSYSGLPKEIEPAVDQDRLKESMAEVFSNNLKVIHYWRPLLPQNTTVEKIKEISDFVAKNALCSVVLGLKYNHQIIENMKPYWDDLSNSRDVYLIDFRISDLIKISLDVKNSFRQIEKQTWHKKEFSKELLVQLGHLSDILLKQTHKLNTLNKLENLEKMGDEIADIILNVVSIWDEYGNTDDFNDYDFKTVNYLMQAKYKEFSIEQCFNELVAKCLEIYTQINIREKETNLNDILRDLLSLAILMSYFTQSDIGSAYLKMQKDSNTFITKNINFQI